MTLYMESLALTTAGDAGLATASGSIVIEGDVEWVYLDYHASAPATTDVTLAYSSTPPGGNILVVSNSATDALKFPRATCVDNANSAITNSHTRFPVWGPISISVAQCDALTAAVTVYIGYSRE